MSSELDKYIEKRLKESNKIRSTSDNFFNKITEIANGCEDNPRNALKEAIFYLCEKYGCEEILTTPFVLNKEK